jgi:hypothetical protein
MMNIRKLPMMALGAVALIVVHTPVMAQNSLTACADISDSDKRLACYDRAAENARNLPVVRLPRGNRPAPSPREEDSGENPAAAQQTDSVSGTPQEGRAAPGTYTVVAARHNDFTGWTIEFRDGGVWKQVGTKDYDIEVGEQYTIKQGALYSYLLTNRKNNNKIRITPAK